MKTLSQPTVGLLIEIADKKFTRPDLGSLLMRADLSQHRRGAKLYTKKDMLLDALVGARDAAEEGDQSAHRGLLRFAWLVVSKLVSEPDRPIGWFDELCESLLADGYQLTWEYVAPDPAALDAPPVTYKLLPTDAGPVPLAGEISALEHELAARGYGDALNHYRQATDAFVQHNYEATNSCLRPALEDIVVRLAGADIAAGSQPLEAPVDPPRRLAKLRRTPGALEVVNLPENHRQQVDHVPATERWDMCRQVRVANQRVGVHRQPHRVLVWREQLGDGAKVSDVGGDQLGRLLNCGWDARIPGAYEPAFKPPEALVEPLGDGGSGMGEQQPQPGRKLPNAAK